MQLRSRITLAAAFFLLAPAVLFFLIDLMRDRFIASSFVERRYENDQPFVAGFVREARLLLEAPEAELRVVLSEEVPPASYLDPDTGTLIYDDWPTMQFRLEKIAEEHPDLSFGVFDRDGQLLVDVGDNADMLPQGYDGTNRSQASGVTGDGSAYIVRRTIRTLRGLYVYVGAIPMESFIQNISNSLGEPVALIQREVVDNNPTAGGIPGDVAGKVTRRIVALPDATAGASNRYQQASEFWASVEEAALAPMPRRYFTIAANEHRGIVTEIRVRALSPTEDLGLFVRLVRDQTRAAIREERQNRLVYGGFTVLILVSVVLLLWFFNRSFRPLTDLIEALRALTRHDFDYRIPHTNRRDELGALARGLTDFRESLVDRERLVSLKEQMEFAAQIQRSILPHEFRVSEAVSIDAVTEPAEDVGGDFFDVFALPNGNTGIVVADVADKGMGSALFGALASSLVRATARLYDDPGRVLSTVNRQLCERNEANLFVTLFYGVIEGRTGKVNYCNAGHEPPLHLHDNGQGERKVDRTPTTKGLPLGLVPDALFESASLQMNRSDGLVLFTDGITEAEDAENHLFSSATLNAILARQTSSAPRDIIRSVLRDVQAFTGDHPQSDDITLMVVRYDGIPGKDESTNSDGEEGDLGPKLRVISS